jgi:tetratricopeptide (TPR) repeat protein
MKQKKLQTAIFALALASSLALEDCSSVKSFLAADNNDDQQGKPIHNPFFDASSSKPQEAVVVRSRQGDRSVEVEMPTSKEDVTDMVIPVQNTSRSPASDDENSIDNRYKDRKPTATDHEITSNFPHASYEDDSSRSGIEKDLGLKGSNPDTPDADASYLAGVDHVKQLFRNGRYEAALIETDDLLRMYPTSPRLYEMRGTLLDRVGQTELAIKSWQEALHFDPKNESLKRYIERKRKIASVPSP